MLPKPYGKHFEQLYRNIFELFSIIKKIALHIANELYDLPVNRYKIRFLPDYTSYKTPNIIKLFKPVIYKDGDSWYAWYGLKTGKVLLTCANTPQLVMKRFNKEYKRILRKLIKQKNQI